MIEALANSVSALPPPSPRVRFAVASPRDDASIRHLLRTNPMNGAIRLTFEREPEYFQSYAMGEATDRTIVAYENKRLVCMGRTSGRRRFVNGQACSVGYLGELRLDRAAQGRFDILRRGYRFFRALEDSNEFDPPGLWFTSIASDNHRSLRFLERNLPGMPRYEFAGEFVTLLVAVPTRQSMADRRAASARDSLRTDGYRIGPASAGQWTVMARLLNEHGARHQLSSEWTPGRLESLTHHGLAVEDWLCVGTESELVACAALWDQRRFRQTVIRGYSGALAAGRPFFNLLAAILGRPKLPPVDSVLAHAFLSPIATKTGCGSLLTNLVDVCLALARRRGLEFLTLGFAANDPSLPVLRRQFPCREYRSRLYRVVWAKTDSGIKLEDGPLAPEVALL